MVIRTQKITRPKRMVSRSRLSTPATPSSHATMLHLYQRRTARDQQVDYVDHEGGVEQKCQAHAYQPPAANLDGIRQGPAVEQDEQRRVEEHHEPAPNRGEDQQKDRLNTCPYEQ